MKKTLLLIFVNAFVFMNYCYPKNGNQKCVPINKTISNSAQTKEMKLNGVWINLEYLDNLKINYSVTQAESNIDFWLSILVKDSNQVEAMEKTSLEPSEGKIGVNVLKIGNLTYPIKKLDGKRIQIKDSTKTYYFSQLDSSLYKDCYDGIEYLNSFIFYGQYKFIDSINNKEFKIIFKEKNQLNGFPEYTFFNSFSLLDIDILSFTNSKNIGRYFKVRKSQNGYTLKEVEIEDMEEGPINLIGKEYRIENY